jgi:protein TonB
MKIQNPRRHVGAFLFMIVGCALVFGGVLAMNLYSEPPARTELDRTAAFEVDKKPPPPPQQERKTQQKKQQQRNLARSAAPTPEISSQLSGVSFGLPQFDTDLSSSATDSVLGDSAKKLVMTEDSVDKPAEPVKRVPPDYPPAARKRGLQGYVTLNVLVKADGSVEGIRVVNADPPGIFDDAAKQAIAQWVFRPAEYQGAPVSYRCKQTIKFQLQ